MMKGRIQERQIQERQITISEQTSFTTCDWKRNENEKNKLLRHHGLTYLKKNVNCGIASTLYSGL